jgi:hypothetical protein
MPSRLVAGPFAIPAATGWRRFPLLAALAFLLVTARAGIALNVGGPVCTDATWHVADSPIVVASSVLVGGSFCSAGANPTLTIEPGVEVRFLPNRYLDVFTKLVARGTAQAPILFTAEVTSPSPGYWFGIRFEATAQDATFDQADEYTDGCVLEYSVLEFAQDAGSTLGVIAGNSTAPRSLSMRMRQSVSEFSVDPPW